MQFNNDDIKVGVEMEFQLVTEFKDKLQTVYVIGFYKNSIGFYKDSHLIISDFQYDPFIGEKSISTNPSDFDLHCSLRINDNIYIDMGNIEISSNTFLNYNEAILQIENLLNTNLIPILQKQFDKFALFLPACFCKIGSIYLPKSTLGEELNYNYYSLGGNKHINLDYNIKLLDHLKNLNSPTLVKDASYFSCNFDSDLDFFEYNYINNRIALRIEIKVPYHFSPPSKIEDWPDYNKILIPPTKWGTLVGYYKNQKWHQIRDLI